MSMLCHVTKNRDLICHSYRTSEELKSKYIFLLARILEKE